MLDLSAAGIELDSDNAGFGPELGLPLFQPENWDFGRLLGTGSFGAVHEARNVVTGRVMAVKALAKSLAAGRRLPSRGTGRRALLLNLPCTFHRSRAVWCHLKGTKATATTTPRRAYRSMSNCRCQPCQEAHGMSVDRAR